MLSREGVELQEVDFITVHDGIRRPWSGRMFRTDFSWHGGMMEFSVLQHAR